MALDTKDKKYIRNTIGSAVDRSEKRYAKSMSHLRRGVYKDMDHRIGLATEEFQDRLKAMGEVFDAKIRVTVREELGLTVMPVLTRMETKMDLFQEEMAQLRRDHNSHVSNYAIHRQN